MKLGRRTLDLHKRENLKAKPRPAKHRPQHQTNQSWIPLPVPQRPRAGNGPLARPLCTGCVEALGGTGQGPKLQLRQEDRSRLLFPTKADTVLGSGAGSREGVGLHSSSCPTGTDVHTSGGPDPLAQLPRGQLKSHVPFSGLCFPFPRAAWDHVIRAKEMSGRAGLEDCTVSSRPGIAAWLFKWIPLSLWAIRSTSLDLSVLFHKRGIGTPNLLRHP